MTLGWWRKKSVLFFLKRGIVSPPHPASRKIVRREAGTVLWQKLSRTLGQSE
jgi:hypothetical protein